MLQWYLKKPRDWQKEGLHITVLPGVFHPGFFFSTTFLLKQLKKFTLDKKAVLEIGSGSGFLSVYAAKMNAHVVSCDLNPLAVTCTKNNFHVNQVVPVSVVESDLFMDLPPSKYDVILINPPYYKQPAGSPSQAAWNAGEDYGYFKRLFKELPQWMNREGMTLMVLSEACDCNEILNLAIENRLDFVLLDERNFFFEAHYIYRFTHVK